MSDVTRDSQDRVGYDESLVYAAVRRYGNDRRQQEVDIDAYLPSAGPNRLAALYEMICIDLEQHLSDGKQAHPGVQAYLDRFPELASQSHMLFGLLKHEFELRRSHDTELTLESFLQSRYPHHATSLLTKVGKLPEIKEENLGRPRFEILNELGRGGMGVVYRARHLQLDRVVALKMILAGNYASTADLARFQTEGKAIARLQHPNIVQVFEVGEHEGRPFLALEFLAGSSLAKKLKPLPTRQAAELAEKVARAMQVAHQAGVIHRDLKPANVLLTADWEPKISDFGLAKIIDDRGDTQSGRVMGTAAYMAPEQAAGKGKEVGPRADVYALGAVLYECLTGRPPFEGATALDTIRQVLEHDPVPPTRLNNRLPRELDTICLKCLEKNPQKRYATAEALANDLRRWMEGRPILALPPTRVVRIRKWCGRNPLGVAIIILMATLVVVLGAATLISGGLTWFAWDSAERAAVTEKAALKLADEKADETKKAQKATAEAVAHAEAEEKARKLAQDRQATLTMMLARSHFEQGVPGHVENLLEQVPPEFRSAPWWLLKNYISGGLFTLRGHTGDVISVAFTADGQLLASATWDRMVKVWDARTGHELRTLQGHTGMVRSVAFAATGDLLASASEDKTVKVWNARTGVELRVLRGHNDQVMSVAFAADGQVLATASEDKTIKVWDARTGQELRTLRGHGGTVSSVAFSAGGQILASASYDGTVKLWDTQTGKEVQTLRGHTQRVESVAFAAAGQLLASGSADDTVKLWDARTGEELRTLRGHTLVVASVALSTDGLVLASASFDNTVKLWDTGTGAELRTLRGHSKWVTSVAFAPDGHLLASGSLDKTVKLWGAQTGQELRCLSGHTETVESIAFTADGQALASASVDKTVKLWDARTGQELRTMRGHTGCVQSVAIAPNGQLLASSCSDKTVKVWDGMTGKELHTLRGHTDIVWSVAIAADGQTLASASDDETVKLWNARTGQEQRTLRGPGKPRSVVFSPDGQVLASSFNDMVKLWDVQTGQELGSLRHSGVVTSVAFAADGQVLAAAGSDNTVKLWDARTGAELRTLRGHTQGVTSVAFGAGGQILASASYDGTVKLWDVRTGQELRTLRGHRNVVTSVTFAADGQVLASASRDRTIKLWDTRSLPEGAGVGPSAPKPPAFREDDRRFRVWTTAPDLHLHRELAKEAENDKQHFAVAFRLGRYLAAKTYYAANPKDEVKPPFSAPTFPDGIACTGVLYKDSGIAPARLLIGTSRALEGDPANWLNHAFHGGALFRNGEHAKAVAALNEAVKLHRKPSPLTHCLLALSELQMGEKAKAKDALAQAAPAKDAPWEEILLHRLFQPEIAAALAKADGKQEPKEK